ncbi:MAG: ribosomal protein S18-alanine N-acetyltransferase [Erysipelotrichaceae bacterium]|nr:ribosomal protein S18-alanine N-acetyltransferase [Erysipelotrichaceae bacterium]
MIRRMTAEDKDRVIELENSCFSRPWKYSDLDYEMNSNPYAQIYVLEKDRKIVGYYDLWVIFENSELARIAVDPQYRRQGNADLMMDHVERTAADCGCENIALEVRVSNLAAINLYEKKGFIVINTKPNYYETEDGLRMMKGI